MLPGHLGYAADGREVLFAYQFSGADQQQDEARRNGGASMSKASAISRSRAGACSKAPAHAAQTCVQFRLTWT